MVNLHVSDIDRQAFESGYKGNIRQEVLLSKKEEMLGQYMCFEIIHRSIYWHRLILTNKKIIHLHNDQVYYVYLKAIEAVELVCINKNNVAIYDPVLQECLEAGNTPYYLTVNGHEILLNDKDVAMTLLDEINRLITE